MKKHIFNIFAIASLILCVSCSDNNGPSDNDNPGNVKLTPKNISLSRSEQEAVANQSEFGINLLREMCGNNTENTNFVVAPFSVGTALAMTSNGVTGSAQNEILQTVGANITNVSGLNELYNKLLGEFSDLDNNVTFISSNSFWGDPVFTFNETFLNTLQNYYAAPFNIADFKTTEGIEAVNKWIEQSTNGNIKNYFEWPRTDVEFAIINATSFNGKFTKAFDREKTSIKDFMNADGSISKVTTMNGKLKVGLSACDGFGLVQISYGRGNFRLNLLLPGGFETTNNESVATMLSNLTYSKWNESIKNIYNTNVTVSLPKFEIESCGNIAGQIDNLGIHGIFNSPELCTNIYDNGKEAIIKKILFGTTIKVFEEGTSASSTTIVTGESWADMPLEVKFNRPFAFIIDEASTGTILYGGVVNSL